MGGPRGYYATWNKWDRERQILYDFTYMWNLRKKTSEQTRVTGTENKQVAARGAGAGGKKEIDERDWEVQTSSFKINESWVWNVQCGGYSQHI